jgi:DNA-binding CsgD family transcriptional regulator
MMARGAKQPLDVHTFRLDLRRKDGSVDTVEIDATPLWKNGHIVGRVGVVRRVDAPENATSADVVERAVLAERDRIARAVRNGLTAVFGAGADAVPPSGVEADTGGTDPADVLRRHGLDDTDLAILRLVTRGASNPEIGRQVHLSADAVKDRIGRLMRRLGAHRRAELSAQALRAGIA